MAPEGLEAESRLRPQRVMGKELCDSVAALCSREPLFPGFMLFHSHYSTVQLLRLSSQ